MLLSGPVQPVVKGPLLQVMSLWALRSTTRTLRASTSCSSSRTLAGAFRRTRARSRREGTPRGLARRFRGLAACDLDAFRNVAPRTRPPRTPFPLPCKLHRGALDGDAPSANLLGDLPGRRGKTVGAQAHEQLMAHADARTGARACREGLFPLSDCAPALPPLRCMSAGRAF